MQFFPSLQAHEARVTKMNGLFELVGVKGDLEFSGVLSTHLGRAEQGDVAYDSPPPPPAAEQGSPQAAASSRTDDASPADAKNMQDSASQQDDIQSPRSEMPPENPPQSSHDRTESASANPAEQSAEREVTSTPHVLNMTSAETAMPGREASAPGGAFLGTQFVPEKSVQAASVSTALQVSVAMSRKGAVPFKNAAVATEGPAETSGAHARANSKAQSTHKADDSTPLSKDAQAGLAAKQDYAVQNASRQRLSAERSRLANEKADDTSKAEAVIADGKKDRTAKKTAQNLAKDDSPKSVSRESGDASGVHARKSGQTPAEGERVALQPNVVSGTQKPDKSATPVKAEQVATAGQPAVQAISKSAKHVEAAETATVVAGIDKATVRPDDSAPVEAKKGRDASRNTASVSSKTELAKQKPENQAAHGDLGDGQQGNEPRAQADLTATVGERTRRDARPAFYSEPRQDLNASAKAPNSNAAKLRVDVDSATPSFAQGAQSTSSSRGDTLANARSAEVYKQVENGAFKNLGQGVKQLVIRLDPADLGQVSVILQVRGKEVQAVLRTSNQETSHALNEQMAQLRTQLESQGLKVGKLEVQTQLSDSQTQAQWEGAEQHNRFQENREFAMSAQRWRSFGRVESDLAQEVQNGSQREKLSQSGLDIFA